MRTGDTIVAIASPQGRSPRAIVRLSGPQVGPILAGVLDADPPVGAAVSRLRFDDRSLPVLVARYAAPRSYTGEESAEILAPGNPLLLERILARLLACPDARAAEPGEFTARAYLAGRLTLDQAEGVAATIAAATDEQLRAASDLLSGSTGARYRAWSDEAATLLALVEAGIDFTDQEDVIPIAPADLRSRAAALDRAIEAHCGSRAGAESPRALPRVVLAGEPNAGKSTLFNALLGRRRAAVSPVAGTTRDVLVEPLDLRAVLPGAPSVLLVDMAGLDPAPDTAVHADAQRRASDEVAAADVVIHCDPGGKFLPLRTAPGTHVIRVRTKSDLWRVPDAAAGSTLAVCALDGWNLAVLKRAIADGAWHARAGGVAALLPRHERALSEARAALVACADRCGSDNAILRDAAAVADAIRAALDALGELTGRVSPDDVIGRIFATFCVGK